MKPDFICVGPGRCGTSWMHEVFIAHPEIGTARVKETEYFNTNADRGDDWYESQFPPQDCKCLGEISNNYYLDAGIARRIHDYNPAMRIIFNIRKPQDLLESFYQFGVRRGLEPPPLGEAMGEPIGRFMGSGYDQRKRNDALVASDTPTLIESVQLSRWLQPFLDVFPRDQIFIFDYERFKTEPRGVARELFAFLGVDPEFESEAMTKVVNAAVTPRLPLLGRLASLGAFTLRSIGAFGLLSRLHRSRLVKALLFRPAQTKGGQDVLDRLSESDAALIQAERDRILDLVPQAAPWWR